MTRIDAAVDLAHAVTRNVRRRGPKAGTRNVLTMLLAELPADMAAAIVMRLVAIIAERN